MTEENIIGLDKHESDLQYDEVSSSAVSMTKGQKIAKIFQRRYGTQVN